MNIKSINIPVSVKAVGNLIYSYSPVCDKNSRLLILGTAPSPRSLESGFFYGHPQNRFWRLIAEFADSPVPETTGEKRSLLLSSGVALWDVLYSCSREGSLDHRIKNPVPSDIAGLLSNYPKISSIFLNGSAAYRFFMRFHADTVNIPYTALPSTSPANARFDFGALCLAWEPVRSLIKSNRV